MKREIGQKWRAFWSLFIFILSLTEKAHCPIQRFDVKNNSQLLKLMLLDNNTAIQEINISEKPNLQQ